MEGNGKERTLVLRAKHNGAHRTRDVVERERVAVAVNVRERLQGVDRDGDVGNDPGDEEEWREARGEERDHYFERKAAW